MALPNFGIEFGPMAERALPCFMPNFGMKHGIWHQEDLLQNGNIHFVSQILVKELAKPFLAGEMVGRSEMEPHATYWLCLELQQGVRDALS